MATQQLNPNIKEVSLAQVKEDLNNGLTKWKKDDIGFGSLEKKYNLTNIEAIELFGHSKIKGVETRIPTFIIIDDLPNVVIVPEGVKIEVEAPIQPSFHNHGVLAKIIVQEQPKRKLEAFI